MAGTGEEASSPIVLRRIKGDSALPPAVIPEPAQFFKELAGKIILGASNEDKRHFVLTFRKFGSPWQLYKILVGYLSTDKELVSSFLYIWLEHCSVHDFDRALTNEVLELLQKDSLSHSNDLKLQLIKQNRKRFMVSMAPKKVVKKHKSLRDSTDSSNDIDVLSCRAVDIAKALTQQEFALFGMVTPTDFMHKIGWRLKRTTHGGTSITKVISRFNEISLWVSTEIISKVTKKQQVSTMKQFIKIAVECNKLNNFNSVMEILAGLNNFAVQRLQKVWDDLPSKHRKHFDELDQLMTGQQNFHNYREELDKRILPTLPYFGLFLREFTAISEGNEAFSEDGSVNFSVLKMLGARADNFERYMAVPYKLEINEHAVKVLDQIFYIEDEDLLYKLSQNSEPKGEKDVHSEPSSPSVERALMKKYAKEDVEDDKRPSLSDKSPVTEEEESKKKNKLVDFFHSHKNLNSLLGTRNRTGSSFSGSKMDGKEFAKEWFATRGGRGDATL